MRVAVITGGRDRTPTMAELDAMVAVLRAHGIDVVRHGNARGTDKAVAAYVRARGLAVVEAWSADWDRHGKAAGPIRNRAMLEASGQRDLLTGDAKPPASLVVAFEGGRGTTDCVRAATERGIRVERIDPVDEPRPWNMHHGDPPKPAVYVGRSPRWGGPHPLANPYPVQLGPGESRSDVAAGALAAYRRWLWSRLEPRSPHRDHVVVEALRSITPEHHLGCTCWPQHCHVEVIIAAWRWINGDAG